MKRRWITDLRPDDNQPQPEPACDRRTIEAARNDLGPGPTNWAVQMAALVSQTVLAQGRDPDPAPAARLGPMRRSSESCVLEILRGLHADIPAEAIGVPVEAVASARDAVHAGVSLDKLLRAMWAAHVNTLEALIDALEARPGLRSRAADTRAASRLSYAYVDAFADWITQEYETEREAWAGSVAAARRAMFSTIMGAHQVDSVSAERVLGLRITDHHLGLVIWTEAVADDPKTDGQLFSLVRALAQVSGAVGHVEAHGAPISLWVWLSWRRPPEPGQLRRLYGQKLPTGARVSAGTPGTGLPGLRRTLLQAVEAQRFSTLSTARLCRYDEVVLPALLAADRERAGWFVAETLGALANAPARLEETLRVYLFHGRSRSAAAAQLRVSPGTVAYRVRQALELIPVELEGNQARILGALETSRGLRAVGVPGRAGPDGRA